MHAAAEAIATSTVQKEVEPLNPPRSLRSDRYGGKSRERLSQSATLPKHPNRAGQGFDMSETSQGPGWWLASDGKWYPPESAPGARAGQQPSNQWPPPGQQGTGWPPPGWPPHFGQGPYGSPGYGPPGYGQAPPYGPTGYASPQPGSAGQATAIADPVLGLLLAPWWKRLVGGIIDAVIIGVVGYIFGAIGLFGTAVIQSNGFNQPAINVSPLFGAWGLAAVLTLLYYGLLVGSKRGQTVGMMAMSIAARDARTGGQLGFWRAVARQLVAMLLSLVFWVPFLIDCLAPLWDKRRQAWHDHASNCIVIDLKP